MKKSFSSVALILLFLIAACSEAPTNSKRNSNDPSKQSEKTGAVKSYRFNSTAENCDTYNRIFQTQKEMCYAIQVSELNNNCAENERLAFFNDNCMNIVDRDADQARQQILNVDGSSVDCTLTETGLPTVRHYTGTMKMIMEHTSTRALVTHTAKDGKITLQLSFVNKSTNREINRLQKTWQDEAEPLTLTAPSAAGSPILTCLVSLAQDPNRE